MRDADRDEDVAAEPVSSSLRLLPRRAPVASGWQAPDTVRRSATRRRRARWSAGAAAILAAAVGVALSFGGGGSTSQRPGDAAGPVHLVAHSGPIGTADPADVDAVVAAQQRLALALLREVGDGSNVTVSPASLHLALGMLQNAARGATATEISDALQSDGLSTAAQNAGLAALTHDLAKSAASDGLELASANSLWQQRGFDVKQDFLRTLATYFAGGVWQVDFAQHNEAARQAIDAWTSEQTRGKITKLFDSIDPATVLVLANAVYFHADWASPFNKAETAPGAFTTGAGRQVRADFMHGGPGLRAVARSDYQAVQLPYRGGRFAALAIMPTHGTLAEFVATLTPDGIDAIADSLRPDVSVSMPRFTTTSKIDLKPVLQSLGMEQAFTDTADFSALSDEPTMVSQIIQRDYLQVGEYGTTAAAVTGVGMMPTSVPVGPEVSLDQPFLFLVRDTRTGALLFASEITDPSA